MSHYYFLRYLYVLCLSCVMLLAPCFTHLTISSFLRLLQVENLKNSIANMNAEMNEFQDVAGLRRAFEATKGTLLDLRGTQFSPCLHTVYKSCSCRVLFWRGRALPCIICCTDHIFPYPHTTHTTHKQRPTQNDEMP